MITIKTKRIPNMVKSPLEPSAPGTGQSNNINLEEVSSQTIPQSDPPRSPTEQVLPLATVTTKPPDTRKTQRRIAIIIGIMVVIVGLILGICWMLNQSDEVVKVDEKAKANSSNRYQDDSEDDDENEEQQNTEDISDNPEDADNIEPPKPVANETTPSQVQVPDNNYLYVSEIGVKFKLPHGVTDVIFSDSTNFATNFDGAIYFGSIIKNGKIYDVDICGGKDGYLYYPFFLGAVMRWIPDREHEWWENSPAVSDSYEKIFEYDGVEYYTTTYGGNGCETGKDTPEYVEAVETVQEIINSIEKI